MRQRCFLYFIALIMPVFLLSGVGCQNEELKIGILMPLSNKNAAFGTQTRNGIKLFIDEFNENGGLYGKNIDCLEYDEEGDTSKAVIGYNFLKDNNCHAVITGAASSTSLAVSPISYEDNMPLMITTASADEITYNKESQLLYKNVFRLGFTNSFQAETMAEFAKNQNSKNVAVLFTLDDDYSQGLKNDFIRKCNELEINVSDVENFSLGNVDFSSQLNNIKSKNPDMIFVPYYYETVGLIVSQARKMGINCPLIGTDSWSGITNSVSEKELLENCFYCSSYSCDDPSEISQNFSKKYQEKFGERPNMLASGGYDAAKVLISAIESIIENEKNLDFNSDEFKNKVILEIKQGKTSCVAGDISYDEHNNPKKQALIIKIQDGEEKFFQKLNHEK